MTSGDLSASTGAGASKTAVVTGASRGIGRAVALLLARSGWTVHALARDGAGLDALAREVGCVPAVADLAEPDAIEGFCARLRASGAPVHALVNNAAVMGGAPLGAQSLGEWNRFLAVNATAPWLLVKGLAPLLADGSAIVNVGSVASMTGFAERAAYCASKHALAGLTKALALELAPRRIRVNLLCLGSFDTPGLAELADGESTRFAARQALGRLGVPEEAADAIAFLVSDQSRFMTGSVMTLDGGMLLKSGAG